MTTKKRKYNWRILYPNYHFSIKVSGSDLKMCKDGNDIVNMSPFCRNLWMNNITQGVKEEVITKRLQENAGEHLLSLRRIKMFF